MGKPIGFFGAIALGDRIHSVTPGIERAAAGVVPVFGASAAELPTDSPNWRRLRTAVFDKAESGSGPAGQWALHEWFDEVEEAIMAITSAALAWIGDEDEAATVTVGASEEDVSATITVDDVTTLGLSVGDAVFFSSGAYGVVDVVGAGPPHTFRVQEVFGADVDVDDVAYRAWRIFPACRPLGVDFGEAEEASMDGYRFGMKLRVDTQAATIKSTSA